jgi:cyanophycinase
MRRQQTLALNTSMKIALQAKRTLALSALSLALIPSCASPQETWWETDPYSQVRPFVRPEGTLLIAGGAVKAEGPIFPRFFLEANKAAERLGHGVTRVEIIPTASGDPAGSLKHNWENFAKVAPAAELGGLPLAADDQESAFDPTVVARMEGASALWFTGGDQSRIMKLFRRGSTPSDAALESEGHAPHPIHSAAYRMQIEGGLVGGSSAGAAIMSDNMITGGRSEKALLHGHGKDGVSTSKGMGYFPFGIVDQHFLARGRLGRLLVATAAHGHRYGFGVEENSGMIVTLGAAPMIEVLGASGLCVLDMGPNHGSLLTVGGVPASPGSFPDPWEFEISLLGTGDRWDPLTGKAIAHSDRVPLPLPETSPVPETEPLDPWDSGAIEIAIRRLSFNPETPQVLNSKLHRVELIARANTRFLINSSQSKDLFASNILITISKSEPTR